MKLVLALLVLTSPCFARLRAFGNCEQGGQTAAVSVASGAYVGSTVSPVQNSYPACLVTVYLTGTVTIASIYSDNSGTVLANPFTASQTGYWFFYADNNRYDVKLSGAGIPVPFTLGDISLSDPGGVSVGVLSFNGRTGSVVPAANDYSCNQINRMPFICTADLNFPAQLPGGSLSVGANSITMTPVPLGLNGSDPDHYVWVSGGTGTAEACKISGGSGTSGQTTGTIIITCANTHSGAWTVTSGSGGIREAIIFSNGNAILQLPGNTTLNGTSPIVIDKQHVTVQGTGWSSIIKVAPSLSPRLQRLFYVNDNSGSFVTLRDFAIDGNRANNSTDPLQFVAAGFGVNGAGGVTDILVDHLEIHDIAGYGTYSSDRNLRYEVRYCYIHDNGTLNDEVEGSNAIEVFGVSGQPSGAVYLFPTLMTRGVFIHHNNIQRQEPHYSVTNPNAGGCISNSAVEAVIDSNYCLNAVHSGGGMMGQMGSFTNNILVHDPNLSPSTPDGSSGFEILGNGVRLTTNFIYNFPNGGIVLEGDSTNVGHSLLGASDVTITGNFMTMGSGGTDVPRGISLINAGGIVRGVAITGNRVVNGTNGIFVDTAADIVTITGNNLADNTVAINDTSNSQAVLSANIPLVANLMNAGTVAAASFLPTVSTNFRCGQVVTVTGSGAIAALNVGPTWALAAGCTVTLIPAPGATWTISTGGNFLAASGSVAGKAMICTYNGTKFAASY